MNPEVEKRVALVAGSGRHRVGNVVAQQLAKRGYSIALHYHSSNHPEKLGFAILSVRNTH